MENSFSVHVATVVQFLTCTCKHNIEMIGRVHVNL